MKKIKDLVKLMRIKHYIKNLLVFFPALFSCQLFNSNYFVKCIIGFISVSLLASAVYCINDIKDKEKDAKHPIKKERPIASGRVSVGEASAFAVILVLISLLLNVFMHFNMGMSLKSLIIASSAELLYLVLNIFYSFGLKNVPIVDVVILVSGFLIRILYGAFITEIEISNWLYLTVMMGAFYMGFGKRRNESLKQGDKSRAVLKKYSKEFLDKFMYVSLIMTLVFYSLWCIDEDTIARIGNGYMIYTIPLIFIVLMKYSLDIENNESFGDPVDVIVKDKWLMGLAALLGVVIMGIIYIF